MTWTEHALALLEPGEPTPLIELPVAAPGVRLLLKDESKHPTGSLRHRHARALFRRAVLDGLVAEGTPVVEATGGNAAVAQAWFARRLGLPYLVVMPGERSEARARPVEELGGACRFMTPPLAIYDAAREAARESGGHFLDQFGRAAEHDLAGELFAEECPDWVVAGAGTGATSATLGRAARAAEGRPTRVAVADPENSAYFPGWTLDASDYATGMPSRIEGIGRPRMEPGFRPDLVDLVIPVPDAASVAAARRVRAVTGLPVGGSTGTALWGALELAGRMAGRGENGTVVSIIGDAHPRHLATVHDDEWASAKGLDWRAHDEELLRRTG
ncbi:MULTISPECIES: pyridoxal-phosphate dependent enzyme [unclassified Nonomuraea]|uniref:PLP-dependent cysteine synthase family protein n=1 Tax=unclassified Nonomuraea TaxID=2593643 RepID=UPI0033E8ED0B